MSRYDEKYDLDIELLNFSKKNIQNSQTKAENADIKRKNRVLQSENDALRMDKRDLQLKLREKDEEIIQLRAKLGM